MAPYWFFWAFLCGGIMVTVSDDWRKPSVCTKTMWLILAMIMAGIGIPILASLIFPPLNGSLRYPWLLLSIYISMAMFMIAFFLTLGIRAALRRFFPRLA